jgi:uncharacterized protein DUF2865
LRFHSSLQAGPSGIACEARQLPIDGNAGWTFAFSEPVAVVLKPHRAREATMKQCRAIRLMLAASVVIGASAPSAQAEDFFSALFRAFGAHHVASPVESGPFDYAPEQPPTYSPRRFTSGTAYCVRTCDGRFFPVPAANQTPAESCKNFCPATDTKVFYGPSIDEAASEAGKPYSELPNAFRYRTELVPGCTCNGSGPVGLARIRIEDDKTLRRGDLVVAADGVKVATGRSVKSGASAELTTAPRSLRARIEHRPSIAAN